MGLAEVRQRSVDGGWVAFVDDVKDGAGGEEDENGEQVQPARALLPGVSDAVRQTRLAQE